MVNRTLKLLITCVVSFLFIFTMGNFAYAASDTVGSSVLTEAMVKQYFKERTLNERISFMNAIRESRPNPYGLTTDQETGMEYKVCDNGKLLPSKGESNILVVPVAFADYSAENEESIAEIESAFFGTKTDASNPYESASSYYYRSSFGQMELKGTVVDWYTAEQNRDYYNTATKREELLSSIISYYDEQINYSDYDTRGDGYIDGIYLYIAGDSEGWGAPFSSFTAGTASNLSESNDEGIKVGQYAWLDSVETRTIIYQTGLMLGLEEYYSYAIDEVDYDDYSGLSVYNQQVNLPSWHPQKIMSSDDMMNNMNDDHNAYSKLLLGWIEPTVITDNVTNQELASLQTESLGERTKCLLIPANGDISESSFFIVEYDTKEGNNILSGISGTGDAKSLDVRVFKVDAKKHNTAGRTRQTCLISRIDSLNSPLSVTSLEYCSLTPTSPLYKSTYMYDENGYFRSSGVSIIFNDRTTSFTGHGAVAKINVTIESDLTSEYKYKLEKGNSICLQIYNGLDLRKVGGKTVKIYDENGTAVNTMSFGYSKDVVDPDMPYNAVFKADNSLEPGKYRIEVPEGILFDTIGHFNEAKTIEFSIEEEQANIINEGRAESLQWYSDPLYLTNGKSIIVRWNTKSRYMAIIDADGNFTEKVTELPGEGGGIVSLYELSDGNILYIWHNKYAAVFNEDGEVINSVTFNSANQNRVLVKDGEIVINDHQYDEKGEEYYKRIVFDNSLNEISSSIIKRSENKEFFTYYNSIRANGDDKWFCIYKGCLDVLDPDCKIIKTIDATEYATEIIDVLKESNRKYLLLCKNGNKYGILQLDGHFNIVRYNELSTAYALKGIDKVKNGYALECSIIDKMSIDGIEYMPALIGGTDDDGTKVVFSSGWSHSTLGYLIIDNDFNKIKSFTNEYGYVLSSNESGNNTLIDTVQGKTYNINYNIVETNTCEICNHSFGEWLIERDATCNEPGISYRVCSICGIDEDKPVDALGHSMKEHEAKEATCTEDGNCAYYSCERCGKYFSEAEGKAEIGENSWITDEALGHMEVTDAAVEATCTETGLTAGKHCSVCGTKTVAQTIVPAKGHTEVTDAAVEATCTETGLTAGKHCSVCGTKTVLQTVIPAKGHTEVTDAAVEATCTETGLTAGKHCSVCGTKTVAQTIVPAKGHKEVTDVAVEATCTETGLTSGKHCSVCGTKTVPQTIVPAKGHTEVTDAAVEATCTETGLTAGKHCSVCGTKTVAQTIVPSKGHKEVTDAAVVPTCTETGLSEGKHCSVCGTKTVPQTIVPAKGHKEVTDAAVEATLDKKGLTAGKHCSVCGKVTVAQKKVDMLKVSAPTGVKAASAGYSSIKISWSKVTGATGYTVYRSTSAKGTYSAVTHTASLSYTNSGRTTGTTYYYKVRAYRTVSGVKKYGNYSSVVYAKPIPAVSTGVKAASAGYSSIKVSWGKVTGATGYTVYRSTSKSGKYSAVANTTKLSYTNSGRTTGKTYYYKVRAYRTISGAKKYGNYSSVVYAKAIPAKPVITAKNAGSKKIKITWKKVAGATGYEVYRATSKSGKYSRVTTIAKSSAVSYTNTKLIRGKTYFYKVRAYKTVSGKKVYSSYSSVKYAKG